MRESELQSSNPQMLTRGVSIFARHLPAALMVGLVALSGMSVATTFPGSNPWRFAALAIIAAVMAWLVASLRRLDGFDLPIVTLLAGSAIALSSAWGSGYLEGSLWARLRALVSILPEVFLRNSGTDPERELAAELLLGLTVWLSSWIAVWLLVRLNLPWLALVAPVALIMANQQASGEISEHTTLLMIILALMIIITSSLVRTQFRWRFRNLLDRDSLVGRGLLISVTFTVITASIVPMAQPTWSQTVVKPMIQQTMEFMQSTRVSTLRFLDDRAGTSFLSNTSQQYSDFSDGFSIGDAPNLSDQPEVRVRVDAASAPYLKARSYDYYTGRGWESSVADSFRGPDVSGRKSPELRYSPYGEIAMTRDVLSGRERITARVLPVNPDSSTVFSIDSFLTADIQTVVRMNWIDVEDMPLEVTVANLNALPPDVQLLASLLLQSDLRGMVSNQGSMPTSESMQAAVENELNDLNNRGLSVRWIANTDGYIRTMYVSGRLPVFDDVEAVFKGPSDETSSYRVASLATIASPDQLMLAGTEYPYWVTSRYLQIGETVTDRTVELARDIVGDEQNPYVRAYLIEQWLRNNITYDDTVAAPPADHDLVDHVLFEYRYGYCEHYAAAMTVMLRSLGIPARVVVGYSPGTWEAASSSYLYLQSNAHEWVEVFFPGYGWIPFEPTASRPLGEFDLDTDHSPIIDGESVEEFPTPAITPAAVATPDTTTDNSAATPQPVGDDINTPAGIVDSTSSSTPRVIWIVAAIAASVAGLAFVAWLLWSWSFRGLSPATGLMRRMQRIGAWLGVRSGSSTTAREYAHRFEKRAPMLSQEARRITRAYEIESFGAGTPSEHVLDDARSAWQEIRRKVLTLIRPRRK